jgi:hypothetical protein
MSTIVTVVAVAHAGIVLVMAIGQVCKVNKRGVFTISVFLLCLVVAGIPMVLEADRITEAACGYFDYSMSTMSSWTACSVITSRAAIRDNGSLAEFFLDGASGNFSHTPYLHDFAAFDDHTIVNSTAVDGTPMVSMSGGTVDVIALDRQRRLYAFTVGNVRYATSCNARLLGQYEQATWGHHLFTDTNLLIRKDGAQLPVNIVQRHGRYVSKGRQHHLMVQFRPSHSSRLGLHHWIPRRGPHLPVVWSDTGMPRAGTYYDVLPCYDRSPARRIPWH